MATDASTIEYRVRKWVVNLWTVAMTVLGAAGLNPLDLVEGDDFAAPIARFEMMEVDSPPGLDSSCVLNPEPHRIRYETRRPG